MLPTYYIWYRLTNSNKKASKNFATESQEFLALRQRKEKENKDKFEALPKPNFNRHESPRLTEENETKTDFILNLATSILFFVGILIIVLFIQFLYLV